MSEGEQPALTGRYGLLLLTLIAAYLFSALGHSRHAGPLHIAFVAAIGLLALRNIRIRTGPTVLAVGLLLVTAVAAGFCVSSDNRIAEGIGSLWSATVLLMTIMIIIERVVRLSEVTVQSLYAAFSAYLLIGMMFSAFFGALSFLVSGPFFASDQPVNPQTLQYFSFTTLTTLGYGDFTAVGSLGRSIAVLEALIGQVFLATLVARLVSLYGAARRPPPPAELRSCRVALSRGVTGWRSCGVARDGRGTEADPPLYLTGGGIKGAKRAAMWSSINQSEKNCRRLIKDRSSGVYRAGGRAGSSDRGYSGPYAGTKSARSFGAVADGAKRAQRGDSRQPGGCRPPG